MSQQICPLCFSNSNGDMPYEKCKDEACAWWSEESQKCAILVIAESQRKAAKAK